MASSSTDILSSLGLTADSPLETILEKLINYNLVTTDEIHNIKNISVLPLPNIVRNQADILKERMYGIATNEDYGIPVVINRRMVLIRYILDKLNIKIEELIEELTNGSFVVKKAEQDSEGNDIVETYETKVDSTAKNTTITNRVSKLEGDLSSGFFVVGCAKCDDDGNIIKDYYETKSNSSSTKTSLETKITTAEANSKSYTDSEITRLYNLILGDSETLQGTYDTFKEIAKYIADDVSGAAAMLASINQNTSDINNLKTSKANSSDVYNKTTIDNKVNEINAKIDEVQTGNSTELANYYNKTQSDNLYARKEADSISLSAGSSISLTSDDENVISTNVGTKVTVGNVFGGTDIVRLLSITAHNGGSTTNISDYTKGTSGQVLTSNGATVYWGNVSDTKNTAGSTNKSIGLTEKIYLIGASSQAESPQTYSSNKLYLTTGSKLCVDGSIQFSKLYAPKSAGSSNYSMGEAGQVLTSTGATVYWKNPSGLYRHDITFIGIGDIHQLQFSYLSSDSSTPTTAELIYQQVKSSASYMISGCYKNDGLDEEGSPASIELKNSWFYWSSTNSTYEEYDYSDIYSISHYLVAL